MRRNQQQPTDRPQPRSALSSYGTHTARNLQPQQQPPQGHRHLTAVHCEVHIVQQRVVFVSYGPRSNQCLKNRRLPPPTPVPQAAGNNTHPIYHSRCCFARQPKPARGAACCSGCRGRGRRGRRLRRSDKITWRNYHNIKIKSEVLSTAVLWVERRLIRLYSLVDIFMVIMLYLVRTGGCKETPSTDQHRPQSSSHDKQLTAMYG